MVVRRKYTLPTCTLIVEGLEAPETEASQEESTRPLLSVLVSSECHIVGKPNALSGDRDFMEALATAASDYAQGLLGQGKTEVTSPDDRLRITPIEGNLHRLTARSQTDNSEPLLIDLTTLQLFDLVEAVDQFLSDRRTLPDRTLALSPRTRREAHNEEPLTRRAAPLAIGFSSLVAAAILLSPLPIPEVERPREPEPTTEAVSELGDDTPAIEDPPLEDDPEVLATDSDIETEEDPEAPTPVAEANIPETTAIISDPDLLLALRYNLYQQVNSAWRTEPTFEDDLVYRVSVGEDGAIVGYRPESDTARQFVEDTPLPELSYIPVEGGTADVEALAEYRVVFRDNGVLEVSPWDGYPSEPAEPPTLEGGLVDLGLEVRDRLYEEWGEEEPAFDRDLEYRLAVTEDGTIAQYEALSGLAARYYGELPIEGLYDPAAGVTLEDERVQLAPLAEYRVVFTPQGIIEISPWEGRR